MFRPIRSAEHSIADRARGGAVDGEDQHYEQQISEFEEGPGRAEQPLEEAPIIERLKRRATTKVNEQKMLNSSVANRIA